MMAEKILVIQEVENIEIDGWTMWDGYQIDTTDQTIYVAISNGQSCCESWGYLVSDDDLGQFINAELRSIVVVDAGLNTKMVEAGEYLDEGEIIFVNFDTSEGLFQIACYNAHNGYYGHTVRIVSKQVDEELVV